MDGGGRDEGKKGIEGGVWILEEGRSWMKEKRISVSTKPRIATGCFEILLFPSLTPLFLAVSLSISLSLYFPNIEIMFDQHMLLNSNNFSLL